MCGTVRVQFIAVAAGAKVGYIKVAFLNSSVQKYLFIGGGKVKHIFVVFLFKEYLIGIKVGYVFQCVGYRIVNLVAAFAYAGTYCCLLYTSRCV